MTTNLGVGLEAGYGCVGALVKEWGCDTCSGTTTAKASSEVWLPLGMEVWGRGLGAASSP